MEYIKADDLRNVIYDIEPFSYDYFNQGVTEQMVLDKQQEIADILKELEIVEVDDEYE